MCFRCRRHAKAEDAFNEFAENTLELLFRYKEMANECKRLQKEVDKKTVDIDDLEGKLVVAKKLVDQQRRKAERIKGERDSLVSVKTYLNNILKAHSYWQEVQIIACTPT